MKLPFLNRQTKAPDEMVAIDLGRRTTKAVHLQRANEKLTLCGYMITDSPVIEKVASNETWTDHLKTIIETLKPKNNLLSLTLNANDVVLRTAEAPLMSRNDFRLMLKHSSKTFLQQELTGYSFDVHKLVYFPKSEPQTDGQVKVTRPKQRVLIAGAKKQLLDNYVERAKGAGSIADHVVPGLVAEVNAFELARPDIFLERTVALVDVGFNTSSICILNRGDIALIRVVAVGGDRITTGVSESMNITYAEAEGLKLGMAGEVRPDLETVIVPLGRELRASIDCFEHEHDEIVSCVFICGGSARSDVIREILQNELRLECNTWDPVFSLGKELSPQQDAELEQVGPQLAVAVGAALTAM
jgi:Tfp pilus assembly PilM family ATPase